MQKQVTLTVALQKVCLEIGDPHKMLAFLLVLIETKPQCKGYPQKRPAHGLRGSSDLAAAQKPMYQDGAFVNGAKDQNLRFALAL